mmetsp:Transcript_7296/g.13081  ORF Transcript_7296/g.13081 Transcript_7296/m.13081 type:complete len:316 (+) Transcript_7296:117-1064(+)
MFGKDFLREAMTGVEALMKSPARKKIRERLDFDDDNKENVANGAGASSASGAGHSNVSGETWMVEALKTSLSSFGQAVEKQLSLQQQQLQEVREGKADKRDVEGLLKRCEDLEKKVEELLKQPHSSPPGMARPGDSGSASAGRVVRAERNTCIARMGALGWDDTAEFVETSAKQVLEQAGVSAITFHSVCAVRPVGSLAEMCFNSVEELDTARLRVRTLKTKIGNAKSNVWLDFKKTSEELRPNRVIRRAVEFCKEEAKLENVVFTREGALRKLKVGSTVIGKLFTTDLILMPEADGVMGRDVQDNLLAFANSSV